MRVNQRFTLLGTKQGLVNHVSKWIVICEEECAGNAQANLNWTGLAQANEVEMAGILDRTVLAAATFGNKELEHEVLGMFVRQSEQMLSRLQGEATPEAQAEILHTLKGSARSIGALAVAEICQRLETELGEGGAIRLDGLEAAIVAAQAEINSVLAAGI